MPHAIIIFLVFLFSAGGVLCALVAICYPRTLRSYPLDQRLERIAATGDVTKATQRGNSDTSRKRSVEETLREAAARAEKAKPSLTVRLRQAQLNWSKKTYYAVCFIVAAVAFLLVLFTGLGNWPALGFGVSAGLL